MDLASCLHLRRPLNVRVQPDLRDHIDNNDNHSAHIASDNGRHYDQSLSQVGLTEGVVSQTVCDLVRVVSTGHERFSLDNGLCEAVGRVEYGAEYEEDDGGEPVVGQLADLSVKDDAQT